LGHYFDVPEPLTLSKKAADQLLIQATELGNIPETRIDKWKVHSRPFADIPATLMQDFRHVPGSEGLDTWSVEIKPKAGYITTSPLVHKLHRVKFEATRFSIQQRLLSLGISRKDWKRDPTLRPSKYNPLDIYSGSELRVNAALEALFMCPQNNLQLWHNDVLVHGLGINNLLEEERAELIKLLRLLLCSERVLSLLLRAQSLDVIDADGAVLVYSRLVFLCNGNETEADILVDNLSFDDDDRISSGGLKHSPFPAPDCPALKDLLNEIEKFDPVSTSEPERDSCNNAARALVDRLSKEGCVYLLKNWLLSLAMSDVSIMIAISTKIDLKSTCSFWKMIRLQQNLQPGKIMSREQEVLYRVKVVDCDSKPAKKLRVRGEKEGLLRQLSH
jgi:inositol-pentakisphosphate 2-kinase